MSLVSLQYVQYDFLMYMQGDSTKFLANSVVHLWFDHVYNALKNSNRKFFFYEFLVYSTWKVNSPIYNQLLLILEWTRSYSRNVGNI